MNELSLQILTYLHDISLKSAPLYSLNTRSKFDVQFPSAKFL